MPNKTSKKPVKKPAPKAKAAKPAAGKAKAPAKGSAKAPAKSAKAAPHKHSSPKGSHGHGKSASKEHEKVSAKAHGHGKRTPQPEVKPAKKDKAPKKEKKKKGGKEGFDPEDEDLLASDEEIGSEEIPDLSEFDDEEGEDAEDGHSDESLDESAVSADLKPGDDEIVLTDAEGRRYCRVRDCDQISAVEGYCRYHYLLLWKKIQVRRKILADGKLERYVEELTSRYPDKFLEMIRKDLRTEKDFLAAIAELEIDESAGENEFEDETQSYVDEIRGMTSESGMGEEEEF